MNSWLAIPVKLLVILMSHILWYGDHAYPDTHLALRSLCRMLFVDETMSESLSSLIADLASGLWYRGRTIDSVGYLPAEIMFVASLYGSKS